MNIDKHYSQTTYIPTLFVTWFVSKHKANRDMLLSILSKQNTYYILKRYNKALHLGLELSMSGELLS